MSKSISELHQAVVSATEAHQSAQSRASIARNEETDARNRLNEAQKAFDAAVAEMRKQAPRDSEWKRERGVPA